MANYTYTTFTSNAGHSAKSPGAGANGYEEHTQARLCNKAFIKAMKQRGHYVVDTTSDAANKTAVLQEQVAKVNRLGGGSDHLAISWHLNSSGGKGGSGVEVLFYGEGTRKLAAEVSEAISKALGVKNRGAKQRKDLYFLKHSKPHAVLIEVCFVDSLIDMQKLLKKRSAVAEAVADVLVGPFDSSTEPSTSSTVSTGKIASYKGTSLVDGLKAAGIDSSFSNRAKLAVQYGIVKTSSQYKGTAAQNTALLKAMRGDA